jgi:transposase
MKSRSEALITTSPTVTLQIVVGASKLIDARAHTHSRSDTFLGARYRRLARRRGKQKAIVATGNSVLTVIYHLLCDPDARFCDLGPGYYESRINKHRRARDLATQLQVLTGQHIVIRDGKAVITDTAA